MSNTQTSFGFRHIGYLPGYAADYQLSTRLISSANTTKIFMNDPVQKIASSQYIGQASSTTATVDGVFQGCMLIPSTGGAPTWSPYWPGAAGADAIAYVNESPGALYLAAALLTSVPATAIGLNIGFAIGAGSTVGGGFSGATLDQSTMSTTNTLPFQVVAPYGGSGNTGNFGAVGNGTDQTSNYAWTVVSLNNQRFKQLTGTT